MTRILITDGDQRSSLAAVRSLGIGGHDVAVTASTLRPIAGASRYCSRTFELPPPAADPRGYVEGVARAIRDFDASVLLPMTDVSAPLLLEGTSNFGGCAIPMPSSETYRRVSDKVHLLRVADSLGVPVPEQKVLTAPPASGDQELATLGLPLILKPARSAVETETGTIRLTVMTAETHREALELLAALPPAAYPVLAQRRIVGPGLGVFLLAWDGRTVASFAHRRLREKPPTGGVSVYREGVAVRADLFEYSRRLLEHFGWRGVAMVEFKEDAATGIPYLMEINGRFWGSLQLAIDSGVDFPRLLVQCLADPDRVVAPEPRLGIRSRWLWGDVDHLLAVLRTPGPIRAAHPELPGRLAAVAKFLVPWKPGDRFEVLRFGDPLPFVRESRNWFSALRSG